MKRPELRENFDHFDRDNNNRIDRDEFAGLMKVLRAGMSDEELDMGFAIIDVDSSGLIDFGEFAAWWKEQ